jgi:phosphate starvation-inducible PhoH-like protein
MQAPPETQVVIDFDDNRAVSALVGPYGQNLAQLERRLGVVVDSRGNHITIAGSRDGCDAGRRVLETLYTQAAQGHDLSQGEVEGAIRAVIAQGSLFEYDPKAPLSTFEAINLRKRPVRARTAAQDAYIRALKHHELVFGIGPAGTGKTYLAMAKAVQALQAKQVNRIILTRPAVEAGERLGYLPGTLSEKIDPYLRPLYDALHDMLDPETIPKLLTAGTIEVAPLAYMRGRTLNDAFIILDEAQNTSPEQMKMFLTRLGFGSRMVVTGDVTQVDLPSGTKSGLRVVQEILDGIKDVSFSWLTSHDVVRHRLVGKIVAAYDHYEASQGRTERTIIEGR